MSQREEEASGASNLPLPLKSAGAMLCIAFICGPALWACFTELNIVGVILWVLLADLVGKIF